MKKTLNYVTEYDIIKAFKEKESQNLDKLQSNLGGYIVREYYDKILKYILLKFPRNNIYIGISEEINKDKLKYYNEIFEFLGATKLKKIN